MHPVIHSAGLTIVCVHRTTFFPVQGLSATSLTVGWRGLWGAGDVGRSHFWFSGWRLQLSRPLSPQLSAFPISRHHLGVSGQNAWGR